MRLVRSSEDRNQKINQYRLEWNNGLLNKFKKSWFFLAKWFLHVAYNTLRMQSCKLQIYICEKLDYDKLKDQGQSTNTRLILRFGYFALSYILLGGGSNTKSYGHRVISHQQPPIYLLDLGHTLVENGPFVQRPCDLQSRLCYKPGLIRALVPI